ncbi:hypothetical protein BH18ACT11_BH18ACT11_11150 [soil metagenome]
MGIEGFTGPGPFDHVVAVLSLHHVEDLFGAVEKMAGLLTAGGSLVVVEFAWDRLDGATARWALGRLPEAPSQGHTSWLERCCRGALPGESHDGAEGHRCKVLRGGWDHCMIRGKSYGRGPYPGTLPRRVPERRSLEFVASQAYP